MSECLQGLFTQNTASIFTNVKFVAFSGIGKKVEFLQLFLVWSFKIYIDITLSWNVNMTRFHNHNLFPQTDKNETCD